MNRTDTADTVVLEISPEDYLSRVADALAPIPAGERGELLLEVQEHLADVTAEGVDLVMRLGTPEQYASDLVSAAGISAAATRQNVGWWQHLLASESLRRLRSHRYVEATAEFLPTLRPAWWVIRGYLAVVVLAHLMSFNGRSPWSTTYPAVPSVAGGAFGLLLVVLAACASVALGRRRMGRTGHIVIAVTNVFLVGVGLLALASVNGRLEAANYPVGGYRYVNTAGLRLNGDPIHNIFPYDAQGRPLSDVQLFDQKGQPIHVANSFSIPGTVKVPAGSSKRQAPNIFPLVWVNRSGQPLSPQPFQPAVAVPSIPGSSDNNSGSHHSSRTSKNHANSG